MWEKEHLKFSFQYHFYHGSKEASQWKKSEILHYISSFHEKFIVISWKIHVSANFTKLFCYFMKNRFSKLWHKLRHKLTRYFTLKWIYSQNDKIFVFILFMCLFHENILLFQEIYLVISGKHFMSWKYFIWWKILLFHENYVIVLKKYFVTLRTIHSRSNKIFMRNNEIFL